METIANPGFKIQPIKADYRKRLEILSELSGLTCFEQEFTARCRGKLQKGEQLKESETIVLDHIWKRHSAPKSYLWRAS